MCRFLLILALPSALCLCLCLASRPAAAQGFVPTSDYQKQKASGFTLYIAPDVAAQGKQSRAALSLLRTKLADATKALPQPAVAELSKVAIFVESKSQSETCVGYHPAVETLSPTQVNPDKAQAIEIGALSCFFEKANGDEPMVLVRELALAYQDRVLGWDLPEINAVWQRARKSGRYDLVPYVTGGMLPPPSMASPQFFFAETSESLFGKNDFFPFHREDLVRYDSDACAAVAKAWGNARLCEEAKKPEVEKKQPPRKKGRYRRRH